MLDQGPNRSNTFSAPMCDILLSFISLYGSQNHDWLIWWKIGGTI